MLQLLQHLSDGSIHRNGGLRGACPALIHHRQLMPAVVGDESRRRIHHQRRTADEQHVRLPDVMEGTGHHVLVQRLLVQYHIGLDDAAAAAPRRPPVAGSIEALPAATPDSAEQRYQQAQQQYRSGNYAAAITLLRHAESGGNGGDTARQSMYLLLQSHQRLANCESVINIGNRYANRFRSSAQAPEALYSVAQCQTRLQQRDIARDTWRRLIQIYPDSAAAKRAYRQMNPR